MEIKRQIILCILNVKFVALHWVRKTLEDLSFHHDLFPENMLSTNGHLCWQCCKVSFSSFHSLLLGVCCIVLRGAGIGVHSVCLLSSCLSDRHKTSQLQMILSRGQGRGLWLRILFWFFGFQGFGGVLFQPQSSEFTLGANSHMSER